MKMLHTSDWHLGQKFISRDRDEEHRLALSWLAKLIEEREVELLVVAGDVFDIGSAPNTARALYFNFLKQVYRSTKCRHIVITGGNHDSPQMLEAPRELLQLLDVHVVGAATDNPADEVILLRNAEGEPEAVVAAVPFLRDQDLRRTATGESGQERIERIKAGILAHYDAVGQAVEPFEKLNIPIIGMGHLCVTGAESSEKQDNIYLGNVENIRADQFPPAFKYVALGHIHRPQAIGGLNHVRYCGSLIPLSFSETKDEKSVTLVEFNGSEVQSVETLAAPICRRLKTIEGNLEEVKERLLALHERHKDEPTPWVDVLVEMDALVPNLNGILQDFAKDLHLDLLKIRSKHHYLSLDQQVEMEELEDLRPIDVFRKKCESAGKPPEDIEALMASFMELEEWMRGREDN